MKIQNINAENLESCASLFTTVFNAPPWSENWTASQANERVKHFYDTPNFIGLYSADQGQMNGCIFGNYEPYQNQYHYSLNEMYVHPDYQGHGIGTQLIEQLMIELQKRNIEIVYLITKTASQAEDFYLKNKFKKSTSLGLCVLKR